MKKEITEHGDLTLIGKIKESLEDVDLSIIRGSFVHIFGRELMDDGGSLGKILGKWEVWNHESCIDFRARGPGLFDAVSKGD